jgi:hypothetical protein
MANTPVPPPYANELVPGWSKFVSTVPGVTSDAEKELIYFNLPQSQQLITITFAATKASNDLALVGPVIVNTADSSVITDLTFTVVNFSTTAMTIMLSGTVDTANYYLKTIVFVVGAFPATAGTNNSGVGSGVLGSLSFGSILNLPTTLGGYGITDAEHNLGLPGVDGYVLSSTTVGTRSWISASAFSLPTQTNNAGKFLITDGSSATWGTALDLSSVQAPTNKILDGNANTFQNIPLSSITGIGSSSLALTDPNADSIVRWNDGAGTFEFVAQTSAGLFGTSTVRGINKEVWLAVRTDGKAGTGTAEDPFNCAGSTPALAATAFDTLMASFPTYTKINLGIGTFYTSIGKTWYIQKGWTIEGCGDATVITLTGSVGSSSGVYVLTSSIYDNNNSGTDVKLRDFKVDVAWPTIATTASVGAGSRTVADGITSSGSPNLSFATTTVASGSNGAQLAAGTLNVASTTLFASSGTIYVRGGDGYEAITYGGKTSTSFTTCTGGSPATVATGAAVSKTRISLAHDFARTVTASGVIGGTTVLRVPSTTILGTSDGVAMSGTYTINATDTSDFASSGIIIVESSATKFNQVVYTGKTSTTFTGCTGGSGNMIVDGSITTHSQLIMSSNATANANNVSVVLGGERNTTANAIGIRGNNILIENVHAINGYGSSDNNLEQFCIFVGTLIGESPHREVLYNSGRNNVIKNCNVEQVYGTYGNPYFMGGGPSKFYNNVASGVNSGFLEVFTSGGVNLAYITDGEVYNNTFTDCQSIAYQDTGYCNRIRVFNNQVIRGTYGVHFNIGGITTAGVQIFKNQIGLQNKISGGHQYGIILSHATAPFVRDNSITWDTTGMGYNHFYNMVFDNIAGGSITDNVFALGHDTDSGPTSTGVSGVTFANNRHSDGTVDADMPDNVVQGFPLGASQGLRRNAANTAFEAFAIGDALTNTASSVDSEIALFSGTDGKTIKRATGSGIPLLASGVLSIATAGTDYAGLASTNAFTSTNSFPRGTITTNDPLLISQTWNAGGVVFNPLTINITDTASAATSNLCDWKKNGASVFQINKFGEVQSPGAVFGGLTSTTGNVDIDYNRNGITLKGNSSIGFDWYSGDLTTSADTGLHRNAAGVVEANDGTNSSFNISHLKDFYARAYRSNAVVFASAITSPQEGTVQPFTDSTTNTWGATITGGGSNHVLGYYNGTNWTVIGK